MEKLISCCGLDCAGCEARIAYVTNDNELRIKTAEKWRTEYNSTEITPEMINCSGCTEAGVKLAHCNECKIRECTASNNFKTCGECYKLESCEMLGKIHQFVPEALANLKYNI